MTPHATEPAVALLEVRGLCKAYPLARRHLWQTAPQLQAVADVSFSLHAGQSLGIVGESGSGKSTLARLVMALEAPSRGSVHWLGRDPARLSGAELRRARRDVQMVFQDPQGSLDPRLRIGRSVAEALPGNAPDRAARIAEALEAVGLRAADAQRYPHEFSGGQRQRIAIARALLTRPKLIVADEPVSALDVSVQAQVLNLMQDLRASHGLSYLLISHDLAVVAHLCDEVAVMQAGHIVEQGPPERLFSAPKHPYTCRLLAAVPRFCG